MKTLYQIIKALQAATGRLEKEAILYEHHGNTLFMNYMKATYDPAINYYIAKAPKVEAIVEGLSFDQRLLSMFTKFSSREVTGNEAKQFLLYIMTCANDEAKELVTLLIKRSIGASVGETMVLKNWPGLFFTVPYMRCSLMDDKIKEKFSKMRYFLTQPKLDGSFAFLVKEAGRPPQAITRAGSHYPTNFSNKLATGLPDGSVLIGEMLTYCEGKMLDRQTSNGILNSVLKGGDVDEKYSFRMTTWDLLNVNEFKAGYSNLHTIVRLAMLESMPKMPYVDVIETTSVTSLQEAYAIYSEHTARGEEGVVIKNPTSCWQDGTSKDNVKLKLTFEIDVKITGVYEGEGKYKGMLGGIIFETSDGLLKGNVGTGFTDLMRQVMWDCFIGFGDYIGQIMTVKANDVVSRRDSAFKSLFLPVFVEIRNDKTEADSLKRVMEQLEAAKQGNL